jgi:hypothetical protein
VSLRACHSLRRWARFRVGAEFHGLADVQAGRRCRHGHPEAEDVLSLGAVGAECAGHIDRTDLHLPETSTRFKAECTFSDLPRQYEAALGVDELDLKRESRHEAEASTKIASSSTSLGLLRSHLNGDCATCLANW